MSKIKFHKINELGCGILHVPTNNHYLVPKSLLREPNGEMGAILGELRERGANIELEPISYEKYVSISIEKSSETTVNKYELEQLVRSKINTYINKYKTVSM